MKKHIKKLLKHTKNLKKKVEQLGPETGGKKKKTVERPKAEKVERVIVELSMGSVAKATVLIILLYFLTFIISEASQIIILFFVAVFLAAAFDPTVDWLQEKKMPRGLGILIIYLGLFTFLFFFISQLIPLLASQIGELAGRVSEYVSNLTNNGKSDLPFSDYWLPMVDDLLETIDKDTLVENLQTSLEYLAGQLTSVAGNTWSVVQMVFNGILNAVIVLVLTFFMVIEEDKIESFLMSLFPSRHSKYIVAKTGEVKDKVGHWLRGQITLAILMGSLTALGFWILGVDYAATLGMIAAIAEFIPMLGPTITFLAAAIIALNESVWLVFAVGIWCAILQFLEGNVFIPVIMRKAVGLSPVVVIVAMLVGYEFFGIPGIILSVPLASVISIFIEDYTKKQK